MTWEYIAGFFDGEGSISIAKQRQHFYSRVSIPQTSKKVLDEICSFVGAGKVYQLKKRKKHYKDNWVYCIFRREDTILFLKDIEPYLIVKRDLVENIIQNLKIRAERINSKKRIINDRKNKGLELIKENKYSYAEIGRMIGISRQRVSIWSQELRGSEG